MMDVEIELRIPTLTIKLDEDKTQRIDNSLVRFRKVIQVPAFPPPGSKIALSIGSDMAFECEIGRADWHEEKQKFVLACKYPKQRIFPHEYRPWSTTLSGNEPSFRRSVPLSTPLDPRFR